MERRGFDWRWVGLIVVVAVLANVQRLPWPLVAVLLSGGGGYVLWLGWRIWTSHSPVGGQKRVTYWRGQRIEFESPRGGGRKLPSFRAIGPAVVYLIIGGALVLAGVALVVRHIGG